MILYEEQQFTIASLDLTEYQKIVLAKAVSAGAIDGQYKHIDLGDVKLTAARDLLNDVDVIDYNNSDDTVTITPAGMAAMTRDGITDETGGLTEIGNQYASGTIPTDKAEPKAESITFKQFLNLNSTRNQRVWG